MWKNGNKVIIGNETEVVGAVGGGANVTEVTEVVGVAGGGASAKRFLLSRYLDLLSLSLIHI